MVLRRRWPPSLSVRPEHLRIGKCIAGVVTGRDPVERIENEIGRPHFGHAAICGFGAGKAAIFSELVDRLAAAANRKVFALVAAHCHASVDIGQHPSQDRAVRQIDKAVAVDVAEHEIVIGGVFEAEKLRRESGDVAGPIHAGDRKRFDQLVAKRRLLGPDDLVQRGLDFSHEGDLTGCGSRQTPEFAKKPIVSGLDVAICERLRYVIAFGFLDIKADLLDPFLDIEVEHLAGCGHTGRTEYRDHMERHVVPAQQADAGDRPIEGAAAGSRQSVLVMKMARAIDADPEIDLRLGEKLAPRIVDQRSIRLKRMNNLQLLRPQSLN